ncbi:MAG: 1-(5-phosphoribosyl)-5-amino-4-imidazole-carboxylate carboxylase [Fibrobacteres bacterium]|nr:1-(5-phosphoribosyl)-5-amino-4-imidazole-carboxylate carboxylase [Fibrobacterota bacterium]
MNPRFEDALRRYRRTGLGKAKLLTALSASLNPSVENLGFARLDHAREDRKGFPEVVFGQGKTKEQIAAIAARLLKRSGRLLVTRIGPEVFDHLKARHPELRYNPAARAAYHEGTPALRASKALRTGHVLILCAGTSDLPVAEEAALTARLLGCRVKALHDVGVAGLHRLLAQLPALRRASVIIAVAGMEGALPSVVAGLVDKPVIGLPTSVGYGASMKGMAALLAMLNSCAPGLTVVNIDNGFGAGFAAAQILRLAQGAGKRRPRLP